MPLQRFPWRLLLVVVFAVSVATGAVLWRVTHPSKPRPALVAKEKAKGRVAMKKKGKGKKFALRHKKKPATVAKRRPRAIAAAKVAAVSPSPPDPQEPVNAVLPLESPSPPDRDSSQLVLNHDGISRPLDSDWTLRLTAKSDDRSPPFASQKEPLIPPVIWGVQVDRKF
jgi:hypothetical protein